MTRAARVAGARLVRVGGFPQDLLEQLARRTGMTVGSQPLDPTPAYDPGRDQYDSTRLLRELKASCQGLVVGAAAVDLFIPVLTFVFGEAELGGRAAVFSIHRLREEFYGLPPDHDRLLERAVRELLHEAGHMAGLAHCQDAACVMSPSHSVELVDAKNAEYCPACARLMARPATPPPH